MNDLMERYAGKFSMRSGSQRSIRPKLSSESGLNSTAISDHIRPSTCVRPYPKLYQKLAHNDGAGHETHPELVKLAKSLARKRKGRRYSYRKIAAYLAELGHTTDRGQLFNPKTVRSMLSS